MVNLSSAMAGEFVAAMTQMTERIALGPGPLRGKDEVIAVADCGLRIWNAESSTTGFAFQSDPPFAIRQGGATWLRAARIIVPGGWAGSSRR